MRLTYGLNQSITLDVPDHDVLSCGTPRQIALDDIIAAVAAALHEPIEFPSLAQSVVSGDHVAIALQPAIPQVAELVAGVVLSLVDAKIEPENISLVVADADDDVSRLTRRLPSSHASRVKVRVHDPRDVKSLAYLAATHDADPIYVNRIIFDADLVIPIGCVEIEGSFGYHGIQGGIFPTFADKATVDRIHAPPDRLSKKAERRRVRELEEAAWLMGTRLTLQVIPGNAGGLLQVVAGDVDAVQRVGRDYALTAWNCPVSRSAELVVAGLAGGHEQQTWHNVARALVAASRIVDEGGAIAICSQLKQPPGPAMLRMIDGDRYDWMMDEAPENEPPSDALAARQIMQTLESVRVYFLSELDEETVEALGMAYVAHPSEIQNLCRRHESTILLANAQHASPILQGTTVES